MTKSIKYISIVFVLAGFAALSAGCGKKLDVTPKQSIGIGDAFKSEEEIVQGIVGCYSIMRSASLYGTDLNIVSELLANAGTATWKGSFRQYQEVESKNMNSINSAAIRMWVAGYQAINLANVIHDVLTGAEAADIIPDTDRRDELIGETEFIRGLLHFELVRLYGKQYDAANLNTPGVVVKLEGATDTTGAGIKPVRNSVEQTYAQVITDLTSAAQKLPETNDVRANKYTALAFLSRVYLQQGEYKKALDAANEVIEQGGYSAPSNNLLRPFTAKNTDEVVFEIQQNDQNNAGTANDGLATFYADLANGLGRGDFAVLQVFLDEYPANDKRADEWYYIGAQKGNISCAKWTEYGQNIPIIRMAEMYLTRAECNIRLGSTEGADPADDLAVITNPDRTGVATPAATLDNVLKQRRLELAFEGLNIHDVRRLRKQNGNYGWNDDKLVMPIPQREIDATQGSLEQNAAYK